MTYYTTLDKEKISLTQFSDEQNELLNEIYELFKQSSYVSLFNFVFSEETLKKLGAKNRAGKYWIDGQLSQQPIYKVVKDLEERLAINGGYLGKNPDDDLSFEENKKILEDYLK